MNKNDAIDNLKTATQKIAACKDFLYESDELFDNEVFEMLKQIKDEISRLELRNHLTKIGV